MKQNTNVLILNPAFVLKNPLFVFFQNIFRIFLILAPLLAIAFLAFYIFQINAEISESYSILQYQEKIDQISEENKNLQITSLQANSLERIKPLISTLNFEKAGKVNYIRVLDNQIVLGEQDSN